MIFLYQTKDFSGELQSSDEGPVYWISMEEFMEKELAKGMKEVMEIMMNPNLQECYMRLERECIRERCVRRSLQRSQEYKQ